MQLHKNTAHSLIISPLNSFVCAEEKVSDRKNAAAIKIRKDEQKRKLLMGAEYKSNPCHFEKKGKGKWYWREEAPSVSVDKVVPNTYI